MSKLRPDPDQPLAIASASELMNPASRRSFVRMLLGGGTALLLPGVFVGCDDDDGGITGPDETPDPVTGISFDLRTDVGIFRMVHVLEQLESAFYTAVLSSSTFSSFTTEEREIFTDIRDVEIIHREFVAAALGSAAVPDIRGSINSTTLNSILGSKATIISTARMFENTGVAALNGAGKYLQDARNLLIAGKFVSVEARHAAALRDIAPPAGQDANKAFAGDDIVDANGLDVKLEAGAALGKVVGTNLVIAGTFASPAITNAPTATQGTASADFFPTNP